MNSDLDAVKRVLEAFERSDWQEIDVRTGGLRVRLVSNPSAPEPTVDPPMAEPIGGGPAAAEPEPEPESGPGGATRASSPAPPPDAQVVTSPSPGIFWRAPEPGAPPFADIGQTIEPATTLCIIEVMKLMNHLKAGVDGRVVAIYPENGQAVAKDEPLFAVAVEDGSNP